MRFAAILTIALAALAPSAPAQVPSPAFDLIAIDRVWSGHRVGFALVKTRDRIFVAYYDANRQLTVASRPVSAPAGWVYHRLDSWTGWDSHNYIAMAVDAEGQVHIVANLHVDPLVYYRTGRAGDVRTFARIATMVDAALEQRMTYPIFLKDGGGGLILKYRTGSSGNGNEVYNIYDPATRRWRPLLDRPLVDGEGKRNAYFVGPTLGPDGYFHIAWVWRESPRAETNHDLSYARSRDLVHWERSDGTPLTLPVTLRSAEIVDRVPVEGGMINNNTIVGFDADERVMITFHKFDVRGNTQIFVARRNAEGWKIAQVSDWTGFRWDFRGTGSLDSRLSVQGPVPAGKDRIRVSVTRDGKPIDFLVDARTLARIDERPGSALATRIAPLVAAPPGMQLNTVEDAGGSGMALAWPSRPPRRDLPSEDIPEPTVLRLLIPRNGHP